MIATLHIEHHETHVMVLAAMNEENFPTGCIIFCFACGVFFRGRGSVADYYAFLILTMSIFYNLFVAFR